MEGAMRLNSKWIECNEKNIVFIEFRNVRERDRDKDER